MSKESTNASSPVRRVKIDDEIRRLWKERDASNDDPENPVFPPEVWEKQGVIGKYYRPLKTSISMRIDNDVLEWVKSKGEKYTNSINEILRERMMAERKTPHRA